MMQDTTALRAELIETARGMNLRGINVNKSGNVSARACRADGAEGFLSRRTACRTSRSRPTIWSGFLW